MDNEEDNNISVEKIVFEAGRYRLQPISIEEAIRNSAGRVKVLENGKRIFDTTYFQYTCKRLFGTEVKDPRKEKKLDKVPEISKKINFSCTKEKSKSKTGKSTKDVIN